MRAAPFVAAGVAAILASAPACVFDAGGPAQLPPGDEPPDTDPPGGDAHLDAGVEPARATAFLVTELELRDPHAFMLVGAFGGTCSDVTDGGGSSVNAQIAELLSEDADQDGVLDRALVMVFRPMLEDVGVAPIEFADARCTAPIETAACATAPPAATTTARDIGAAACDVPPAQNTSGYSPPIGVAGAPCFTTDETELALRLTAPIPLSDFVVSATYAADGRRLTGVLRGFVSEDDAEVIDVSNGGPPAILSRLLPGGEDSCADHDATDVGPGGEDGWYLYFDYTAEAVSLD